MVLKLVGQTIKIVFVFALRGRVEDETLRDIAREDSVGWALDKPSLQHLVDFCDQSICVDDNLHQREIVKL